MTKYAKMLCSLAIGATALATFSLSSDEAFARSGVVRRVAVTRSHPVSQARPNSFVRGRLNPVAASSLRNSRNVSWAKHPGQGNSRLLTEGKGHGHDGDKGHKDGGKEYGKDKGLRGEKEYGDKDKGRRGEKEYSDKDKGRRGEKEYSDKDKGRRGEKEYGDKDKGRRGDKDKGNGKERPLGGQQAGGQQAGGQQGGSGFPDLSSLGSGGGSAPSPASSPTDAGSATTADQSNCSSHHTWRNGQRVLIQVCPDA